MSNRITELSMAGLLIALAIFLLNPFHWWMPSNMVMMIAVCMVVVCGVFVSFVWREKVRDEREVVLRMNAGRAGFLVGVGIATIGIIVQSFSHTVDVWLVLVLAGMVIGKIINRSTGEQKE